VKNAIQIIRGVGEYGSALIAACLMGRRDVVLLLIENGPNVNIHGQPSRSLDQKAPLEIFSEMARTERHYKRHLLLEIGI
jgi:hypothetical protein